VGGRVPLLLFKGGGEEDLVADQLKRGGFLVWKSGSKWAQALSDGSPIGEGWGGLQFSSQKRGTFIGGAGSCSKVYHGGETAPGHSAMRGVGFFSRSRAEGKRTVYLYDKLRGGDWKRSKRKKKSLSRPQAKCKKKRIHFGAGHKPYFRQGKWRGIVSI